MQSTVPHYCLAAQQEALLPVSVPALRLNLLLLPAMDGYCWPSWRSPLLSEADLRLHVGIMAVAELSRLDWWSSWRLRFAVEGVLAQHLADEGPSWAESLGDAVEETHEEHMVRVEPDSWVNKAGIHTFATLFVGTARKGVAHAGHESASLLMPASWIAVCGRLVGRVSAFESMPSDRGVLVRY